MTGKAWASCTVVLLAVAVATATCAVPASAAGNTPTDEVTLSVLPGQGAARQARPGGHHNGGKGHHGHGGKKVKGVLVNVKVTVDFIHRIDDSFELSNGACGSGDHDEDYDPVDSHTAAVASWQETFKRFLLMPGATNSAEETPDVSQGSWQNIGFVWANVYNPGDCRSTSTKIPWICQPGNRLVPVDNSAQLVGTTKASEKVAFDASLGMLRYRPKATECGSASSYEIANPTQYIGADWSRQSILDRLTFNGEREKKKTFVIAPKMFDHLVAGDDLGPNGTGVFPDLPFLADCNHTDDSLNFNDTCEQLFDQKRTMVVHPVKVLYGGRRG